MPLLSNLIVIFPIPPLKQPRPLLQRVLVPLAVGLLVLQAFLFIKQDVQMISDQTNRAQNNPALEFDRLAKAKLAHSMVNTCASTMTTACMCPTIRAGC